MLLPTETVAEVHFKNKEQEVSVFTVIHDRLT